MGAVDLGRRIQEAEELHQRRSTDVYCLDYPVPLADRRSTSQLLNRESRYKPQAMPCLETLIESEEFLITIPIDLISWLYLQRNTY